MSKSHEDTILKLREKLRNAIEKQAKDCLTIGATPSAFRPVEEAVILQMSRLAILLYRTGRIGMYSRILDVRNFLIGEIDRENRLPEESVACNYINCATPACRAHSVRSIRPREV